MSVVLSSDLPIELGQPSGPALLTDAGPVEPERFQVKELVPGALAGVHGVIARAREAAKPQRRRRVRRSVA